LPGFGGLDYPFTISVEDLGAAPRSCGQRWRTSTLGSRVKAQGLLQMEPTADFSKRSLLVIYLQRMVRGDERRVNK
jgi:hypothetical protein